MKILKLEINNILSIEKATVHFQDSGLVLIEGIDHDTGRCNGAGKSAIFNSLSFALFDKIPRKITKSEILRKNSKSGYSLVDIQMNDGVLSVKRSRPGSVSFYFDNVALDITQEEFEKKIGLNYDQFLLTMYSAQDTTDRFINLNDSNVAKYFIK